MARKTKKVSKVSLAKEDARRRKLLAREILRTRERKRVPIRERLARALELVNESHPFKSTIEIKSVELRDTANRWATPWIIVARIRFSGEIGYGQLYTILESWLRSDVVKAIGSQRMSRLRVVYADKRKREQYTLAETAPWVQAISRALEETDPTDTETARPNGAYGSLAARYGIVRNKDGKIKSGSLIPSVDIWLSEQIGFRRAPMPKTPFVGKG